MTRLLAALRLRRFTRDERGAVVVEFALILPLFVLFIFAIMEFARGYQALNAITSAAREGARVAAIMPEPTEQMSIDSVTARAKQVAGSMFTTDEITVSAPTCDPDPANCRLVTVTTSITLTGVTPVFALIGKAGGIPISSTASFRWERAAQPPAPMAGP